MRHEHLGRVSAVRDDSRSTDERGIVEVNHIEAPVIEHFAKAAMVERRPACLLGQEWRENSSAAAQGNDLHSVILRWLDRLRPIVERHEGVDIVYDRDVVSPLNESAGKPLNADSVTAKAERWIERCRKAEAQSAHARTVLARV